MGGGREIAIQTRAIFGIMFELATQVDVPPEHEKKGWSIPTVAANLEAGRILHVRSGAAAPPDTFVKVRYLDTWYWIPHADLHSKRAFTFMNLLSAFVETGGPLTPTLVTVPAG